METYNFLNINLLIIDDDLDQRCIFENFFRENKNINLCGIAKDGLEGIKKAKICNPDVVVTDFLMPNLDGYDVVKNIKNICNGHIKVIVLSGINNARIVDNILAVGADYYMVKPIQLEALSEKIVSIYQEGLISNRYICKSQISSENQDRVLINKFIKELGIPINCSGYKYIMQAVKIMLMNTNGMTLKEIYHIIARNNSTSLESVEACTHNAIKKAHAICTSVYISCFEDYHKKCPSNSVFLNTVKESFYIVNCNSLN